MTDVTIAAALTASPHVPKGCVLEKASLTALEKMTSQSQQTQSQKTSQSQETSQSQPVVLFA